MIDIHTANLFWNYIPYQPMSGSLYLWYWGM